MENTLSGMERMVVNDLIVLLKLLTKREKISLRAASSTMLRRIDELENTFKVWRVSGNLNDFEIRRLADEVRIIQGIFSI